MERPRPVPPVLRARERSARAKRSNSSAFMAGSTPGPSSWTRSTASFPSRTTVVVTVVPAGVWARALARRFAATGVAGDDDGLLADLEHPLVVGPGGAGVFDGLDRELREVDRAVDELLSLVETCEEQQILDERRHAQRLGLYPLERLSGRLHDHGVRTTGGLGLPQRP